MSKQDGAMKQSTSLMLTLPVSYMIYSIPEIFSSLLFLTYSVSAFLPLCVVCGICHSPGVHKSQATIFCMVGSSVLNLPHVTLLAPRILRRLLDSFENLCMPATICCSFMLLLF